MTLLLPSTSLQTTTWKTRTIAAERLIRVSRHASGEPYMGRDDVNRFDDPNPDPKSRFGTCYFGFDLVTAVAETVLHNKVAVGGRFAVAKADFEARQRVTLNGGSNLKLMNFTGVQLKLCGSDGAISTVLPYDVPKQWSAALHAHPQQFDGILYVSRHVNTKLAAVVFDRAQHKLGTAAYMPFGSTKDTEVVRRTLHIDFTAP